MNLSRDALLCLMAAGLVEEDARFGALFSTLQEPQGHRRPTMGLLQAILGGDAWAQCRPMIESGLVQAINSDAPRSEWLLRVPSSLWNALRGERAEQPLAGTRYHSPDSFPPVGELILPVDQISRLTELAPLLQAGRTRSLVVRGMMGSERLSIVGSVARALGRGLLELDISTPGNDERLRLAGPFCSLAGALPVFCLDLGPSETFELPSLSGYRGPLAIIMGREGGLTGPGADQSLTVNIEPETAEYRLRHWQRALADHPVEDLNRIASRFAIPARYIHQAAPLAVAYAALERHPAVSEPDVRQAIRSISRQRLDSLAARLNGGGNWAQLVVGPSTEAELVSLERRCLHREPLAAAMSGDMPGGINRGVRILFEGPSGTGKTLAARVLAAELGLDAYRVDLAAVVNKYIGETEKNLSRVLSRAEDLDVVLLLDEGDALMTRRTDVKTAHDRYANLETNYLLQRIETYTGIVIVTTNAGNYIDSAFRRRFDAVVKFHLPGPDERWRLWQIHLPADYEIDSAALEQVALEFALTGGQIRNAAVHATLLAVGSKRKHVTLADLKNAINVEYRKAGAAFPSGDSASSAGNDGMLTGFLAAIS